MSDVALLHGDCLKVMRTFGDATVDAVVCDPPYELGFMGKAWDSSGVAFRAETWREVLRVLKPGGYLLAFSGTRTYHRMTVAIEDAGFEIRDSIHWIYGSGFPKSLDVSKAFDKAAGALAHEGRNMRVDNGIGTASYRPTIDSRYYVKPAPATEPARQWAGWGTALKPAHEPVVVARKPLEGTVAGNVLKHGTGALNIDGCRVEGARWPANVILSHGPDCGEDGCAPGCPCADLDAQAEGTSRYFNQLPIEADDRVPFIYAPKASRAEREEGCDGLASKTAKEAVFRDPESAGAKNPRAGANRGAGAPLYYCALCSISLQGGRAVKPCAEAEDGAHVPEARGTTEPIRNNHPTVKPVSVMRHLIRLVTRKGGVVLDPFMGSGSTGIAAVREGVSFIGIEMSEEYLRIAEARVNSAQKTHLAKMFQ